ncbi:MAG: hypothetical protein QM736_08490 [Vicinamibacterales bacterium]
MTPRGVDRETWVDANALTACHWDSTDIGVDARDACDTLDAVGDNRG